MKILKYFIDFVTGMLSLPAGLALVLIWGIRAALIGEFAEYWHNVIKGVKRITNGTDETTISNKIGFDIY